MSIRSSWSRLLRDCQTISKQCTASLMSVYSCCLLKRCTKRHELCLECIVITCQHITFCLQVLLPASTSARLGALDLSTETFYNLGQFYIFSLHSLAHPVIRRFFIQKAGKLIRYTLVAAVFGHFLNSIICTSEVTE